MSVTHTADGHNGWNVTSPVIETVTASDAVSDLAGAPTCTDNGNGATLTPAGSGQWTVAVSGDGVHTVTCSVSDNVSKPNDGRRHGRDRHGAAGGDLQRQRWKLLPVPDCLDRLLGRGSHRGFRH